MSQPVEENERYPDQDPREESEEESDSDDETAAELDEIMYQATMQRKSGNHRQAGLLFQRAADLATQADIPEATLILEDALASFQRAGDYISAKEVLLQNSEHYTANPPSEFDYLTRVASLFISDRDPGALTFLEQAEPLIESCMERRGKLAALRSMYLSFSSSWWDTDRCVAY